jgi:hypothetical protein
MDAGPSCGKGLDEDAKGDDNGGVWCTYAGAKLRCTPLIPSFSMFCVVHRLPTCSHPLCRLLRVRPPWSCSRVFATSALCIDRQDVLSFKPQLTRRLIDLQVTPFYGRRISTTDVCRLLS